MYGHQMFCVCPIYVLYVSELSLCILYMFHVSNMYLIYIQ